MEIIRIIFNFETYIFFLSLYCNLLIYHSASFRSCALSTSLIDLEHQPSSTGITADSIGVKTEVDLEHQPSSAGITADSIGVKTESL